MSQKICKGCGNKIPRKKPGTNEKTNKSRYFCYNCRPFKSPYSHPPEHKSERRRRKEYLAKMLGGHCANCGYNKSLSALSFHHKNPAKKSFDISNNGNLMGNWQIVLMEAKKCKLLCLNCHSEIHNGK